MLVVVALSYVPGSGIASCRQQLSSDGRAVSVCGPIGTADLVLLGLLLLVAGAFVWPDLSEFGVAGLVTVKRRLQAQEKATRAMQSDVQNLTLALPAADVGVAVADTHQKAASITEDAWIASPGANQRALSAERSQTEQELLDLAGEMDRYVRMASRLYPRSRLQGMVLTDLDALGRWLVNYDAELRVWATVRNAVIHVPERLSDESVRNGVELGRSLVAAAKAYLQAGQEAETRAAE
jgi:hypothetical protein